MEKIEAGEYVRLYDGTIGKYAIQLHLNCVKTENEYIAFNIEKDVVKHSKDIIDLIEKGDYVNGYPVRENNGKLCNFDLNNMEWIPLEEIDVWESIVTKEQFESVEYKVGEE